MFGVWAAIGGYISLGSAVVMGIIVDDSMHLLYRHYRRGSGSVLKDTTDVAPALLVSSVALVLGLEVALLSDFRPIMELGMLSIAIIISTLFTDVFLLPALLSLRESRRNNSATK